MAVRLSVWFVLLLLGISSPLRAQQQRLGWSGSVEGSANMRFGNSREWLVSGSSGLARTDSALGVRASTRVSYAERASKTGQLEVAARNWLASLALDQRPFATFSPFVSGSVESSFQQKVHRRYSFGAGGKYSFVRSDANEASLSAALLGERTTAGVKDTTLRSEKTEWLLRWSVRGRVQHRLAERVRVTHVTFYQPSARAASEFLVNNTSGLIVDLTNTLALTLTYHDTYDSQARGRGARSNYDGEMLFGVRAKF